VAKYPLRRGLAAFTVLVASASVLVGAGAAPATSGSRSTWVGTWSTAITQHGGAATAFNNQSIRMMVHTSVGGDRVRVRLSNNYGLQAVAIGKVTVALPVAPASPDLQPETLKTLTFGGSESVTMYKGSDVLSDPVDMAVPAASDLTVTYFMPTPTGPAPFHFQARQRSYIYPGDHTAEASGAGATATSLGSFLLAGVDVSSRKVDSSVVVLGDSISDGFSNTIDAHHRWPDFLAARVLATPTKSDDVGVLNQSLSGNRLTRDGIEAPLGFNALGNSGLARLDSDVFGQTAAETVILELGVNDVLFSIDPADRIIAGIKQFAAQAREKNLRVLVCTLMPFEGFASPPWTPEKEAIRVTVNSYIRGSHDFQGVVDIDAVMRDPAAPTKIRAEFDSGDHIHPNDAGAQAIANAVPLSKL